MKKQFMSGIIIGAVVASAVSVYASGSIIEAIKTNDTYIYIDGKQVVLEDGYAILNYEGRTYTSVRSIAEGLGADVNYTSDSTGKYVNITSKPPVIVTPTPTPTPVPTATPTPTPTATPTPSATPTPTSSVDYRYPPVRSSGLSNSVYLYSAVSANDRTVLQVDVKNNNYEGASIYEYYNFKLIDEAGKEYRIYQDSDSIFYDSIPNDTEMKRQTLKFPKLPVGSKLILSMPLDRYDVGGRDLEEYTIEIPFIVESTTGDQK